MENTDGSSGLRPFPNMCMPPSTFAFICGIFCMRQVAESIVVHSAEDMFVWQTFGASENIGWFLSPPFVLLRLPTLKIAVMLSSCISQQNSWLFLKRLKSAHIVVWPTGFSGAQSSHQKRRRCVWGAAAGVLRPHVGRERNLQWGGGGNAQHPVRVSPGAFVIIGMITLVAIETSVLLVCQLLFYTCLKCIYIIIYLYYNKYMEPKNTHARLSSTSPSAKQTDFYI